MPVEMPPFDSCLVCLDMVNFSKMLPPQPLMVCGSHYEVERLGQHHLAPMVNMSSLSLHRCYALPFEVDMLSRKIMQ